MLLWFRLLKREKNKEACKTSVTNATDWRINHRVYVAEADNKKREKPVSDCFL